MKFDKVIMNPPYGGRGNGSLHLKILAKAIEKLKEDGVCVNLSPARWLQDPLAKYKKNADYQKFEDSVVKHITSLTILEREEAAKIFNIKQNADLAIVVCSAKSSEKVEYFFSNDIVNKVEDKMQLAIIKHVDENVSDGWRVRISKIKPLNAGSNGEGRTSGFFNKFELLHHSKSWVYLNGMKDGKHWSVFNGKTGCKVYTENDEIPYSIRFNSEKEAKNFEDSTKTDFHRYLYQAIMLDQNAPLAFIPWMGDVVNPRTGKKGYESEWTDEDFYTYFGITEDEQKLIKETMEKYK